MSDPSFSFIPPAHAHDELQLSAGAEAEHMSVGAEGPHGVGAGARDAEPTVSLPAGYSPAAILTRRPLPPPEIRPPQTHTDGSSLATVNHPRDGRRALPPRVAVLERRSADFRDM